MKCLENAGGRGKGRGSERWQSSKEPLAPDTWGKCLVTTKTGMKIKIKWEVLREPPPLLADLGSFYAAVLRVTKTFCHGAIKSSRWRNHTCQIIGHCCILFCIFFQIRLRLALSGSLTQPRVFTPVVSPASTCLIFFSISGFASQRRRGGMFCPCLHLKSSDAKASFCLFQIKILLCHFKTRALVINEQLCRVLLLFDLTSLIAYFYLLSRSRPIVVLWFMGQISMAINDYWFEYRAACGDNA